MDDPTIATSNESSDAVRQLVVVADRLHGIRLMDFLQQRWPEVARTEVRNLVLNGLVRVNADEILKPRRRLRGGDVVEIALPGTVDDLQKAKRVEGDEPRPVVLFEDDTVLVVDKPAGMAVVDRSERKNALLDDLVVDRPNAELRVVNRPDRDASGCVLVAKDLATQRRFEQAGVELEYVALVQGTPRWREHQIDRHLGPDPQRPGRIRVVDAGSKGARAATTQVTLQAAFRNHSLVHARPLTPRNHQIRVHLACLGHPIVADPDYGSRDRLLLSEIKKNYKARAGVVERPLLSRMFLHVSRVRFSDSAGEQHEVVAPLPRDLELVLAKLTSFARKR